MASKKKQKKQPQHFALITFDLHKADRAQRDRVHKAMSKLGIDKKLKKRNGHSLKPPHNTFTGLFPAKDWPSTSKLADHLRAKIKKAIKREGLAAILVVAVSANYAWAVTEFKA
ncbi:hypothetical protein PIN31009_05277 [Pandoraea iniqua]|uniref:hypothetical protein n=1 Tax=Pandoraea iniqua TaxID=2508288 RepID=UPI0012425B8A|nr:hypothetical protein [Pandoraea iniqua]VVE58314.1 hypothetical protein PIN31009_05277 [Pandoraea iniqua]